MLRRFLPFSLCLVVLWFANGLQAQDTKSMPEIVLRAAQALNARYGPRLDLNNVWWYQGYYAVNPLYDLHTICENEDENLPPFTVNNKAFYVIELRPYVNGVLAPETWEYIAYDDMSYFGPCKTPPPPTATPTPYVYVPPTPLPPTAYLSPTPSPTISSCGGLIPRLAIGSEGRVTPGDPNNIRADHGASTQFLGEIPGGGVFMVLDGPRCSTDGTWWQVSFNGIVGWTLEGRDGVYFTEPTSFAIATPTSAATQVAIAATALPTFTPAPVLPTPTSAPIICNAAIPPRLRVGEQARVTAGGIPNNMREQQGRSSKYVGEIPPLGVFTVLEGPVCTGDGAWFKVDYNGIQGWTLEGMESEYWVEPTFPDLKPITITLDQISQLRMMPAALGQMADSTTALRVLSNQGELIGGAEPNFTRWTPADPFAIGDLLTWNASPITIPAPHDPIMINEQGWTFYDAGGTLVGTVAALSDVTPVHAAVSPNHAWAVISQGSSIYPVALANGSGTVQGALQDAHGEDIMKMIFSNDSSTLITLSATKIYAWDTATWQSHFTYALTREAVIAPWTPETPMALSGNGRFLFMGLPSSRPDMASLFLLAVRDDAQTLLTSTDAISQVQAAAFVRDEFIVFGGANSAGKGVLLAVTVDTLTSIPLAPEMTTPIRSLVVNPNGTLIATFNGTEVRMWGVWGAPLDSHG